MRDGVNKMVLMDIICSLGKFSNDDTIYAEKPWAPDSVAIVETEPDEGNPPNSAINIQAEYFLEVFIADEFISGWLSSLDYKPTDLDICRRLIQYAENDA